MNKENVIPNVNFPLSNPPYYYKLKPELTEDELSYPPSIADLRELKFATVITFVQLLEQEEDDDEFEDGYSNCFENNSIRNFMNQGLVLYKDKTIFDPNGDPSTLIRQHPIFKEMRELLWSSGHGDFINASICSMIQTSRLLIDLMNENKVIFNEMINSAFEPFEPIVPVGEELTYHPEIQIQMERVYWHIRGFLHMDLQMVNGFLAHVSLP